MKMMMATLLLRMTTFLLDFRRMEMESRTMGMMG